MTRRTNILGNTSEEDGIYHTPFNTGGIFVKSALYANEELLKSLFQNITPDLSVKYILIHVHDQQGQQ